MNHLNDFNFGVRCDYIYCNKKCMTKARTVENRKNIVVHTTYGKEKN